MRKFVTNNLKKDYYGETELLKFIMNDKRNLRYCIYCGEVADSSEHIPSKAFYCEPYPSNLALLPACKVCNVSFSLDEEYVACLIEFLRAPNFDINRIRNKRIKAKLISKNSLKQLFINSIKIEEDRNVISFQKDRVERILEKLARGHIVYMNSFISFDTHPKEIRYKFLFELSKEEYLTFNEPIVSDIAPEIGSRNGCLITIDEASVPFTEWQSIQDNQYRFLCDGNNYARICIGEFLFGEIIW